MGIKEFFNDKKNKRIENKNIEAYDRLKNAMRYCTSDKTVVRLNGSPDMYKSCFEKLSDEGYHISHEYIEGDLITSGITFVTIKKEVNK